MSEPKCPHGSRFRDALVIINPGACNPSGVALSLTAGAPRQKLRGLAAAEPSGHRDRAENLSKACGPRTTSVGVLSRERARQCASLILRLLPPEPLPCTRKRVGMRRREHPAP